MNSDDGGRSLNLRRDWAWTARTGPESTEAGEDKDNGFSLMSYNVLADCHFEDSWYPYCPEGYRKMADRHRQLMAEISHHTPDIVCLQEVGSNYYAEQLNAAMFSLGYMGVFMNKIRGIKEGGATFYKSGRFQIVETQGVTFNQLVAKACQKAKLSEVDKEKLEAYTDQDHLVLLAKIQDINSKKTISIGNTHLLFGDYKHVDIITMQAGLAINALIEFAGGTDQPHILCGDFNQEPNMPGYQLMHDGKLDRDSVTYLKEWPIQSGGQTKTLADILPECFYHDSNLQSAYKTVMGQEVPFSNYEHYLGTDWSPESEVPVDERDEPGAKRARKSYFSDPTKYGQGRFIASLDYQWFSARQLRCLGTLEMVDERLIDQFYACPNKDFPSDHLSICSRFEFRE